MVHTRLAALATLQVNPQGNVVERKLLLSKSAPHTRLSPAYLFQQNIDPNNLEKGLTGLKFYEQCCQSLTPKTPDDILVAFAMRHMGVLNAMALQNLSFNNLLRPFQRAVDLKTAIATCHYFGEHKIPVVKNLKQAANVFNFKGNISNHLERVDALGHIYNCLMQQEPKIMSFLLRPKTQLTESVLNPANTHFVHINDKGQLCLLKRLVTSPDGVYLKALCAQAGNVDLVVINLEMMPLLAPLGILTPERQERLHFDLNEHIQRLEQVDLHDFLTTEAEDKPAKARKADKSAKAKDAETAAKAAKADDAPSETGADGTPDAPNAEQNIIKWLETDRFYYERFTSQLPNKEMQLFYRQPGTPLSASELEMLPTVTPDLKRLMVCYQYENFPDQRTPELEDLYTKLVTEQKRMREGVIHQECTMLRDNIAGYNEQELKNLNRLFEFFMGK